MKRITRGIIAIIFTPVVLAAYPVFLFLDWLFNGDDENDVYAAKSMIKDWWKWLTA